MKYTFIYESNYIGDHSFTVTEKTPYDRIEGIIDKFVLYLQGIGYGEETISDALSAVSEEIADGNCP